MNPIVEIMDDDMTNHPDSDIWGRLDYPRAGNDDQPDRMPAT